MSSIEIISWAICCIIILFINVLSALLKAHVSSSSKQFNWKEVWMLLTLSFYFTTHRAPELFLGLPITEALDMWSLGCMVVHGMLFRDLFPGKTEYDVVSILLMHCTLLHAFWLYSEYTYSYIFILDLYVCLTLFMKYSECEKYPVLFCSFNPSSWHLVCQSNLSWMLDKQPAAFSPRTTIHGDLRYDCN